MKEIYRPKEEFTIDFLRRQATQLITFPEGTEPTDLTLEFLLNIGTATPPD